jgi:hypothetical protein
MEQPMNVAELLNRARQEPKITELTPEAARGAEGYLQAYGYVVDGCHARTKWGQRRFAMLYLAGTASPPLTAPQLKAAQLARAVVKRLS